jgi:hypothetical protein
MTARAMVWRLGLAAVLLAGAAAAEPLFSETFADNTHQWQLDEAWHFEGGQLVARGTAGQVAVVGQQQPLLGDFRAVLKAHWLRGSRDGAYGFLYRFNPNSRNGYFMLASGTGSYGFGKVEGGEFELKARGMSDLLRGPETKTLQIDVRGDMHSLRCGQAILDVWRDDVWRRGSFGLMVTDAIEAGFQHLEIEALAPLTPAVPVPPGPPSADTALGPLPPSPGPAEGGVFVHLDQVDLDRLRAWRRHYNAMAAALGEAVLPVEPDGADIAVLAWLRLRQETGAAAWPPARLLAELLTDPALVAAGATGPGPQAAVEFALQAAAGAQPASAVLSGPEEQLAVLTWYFVVRSRTAAAWGARAIEPLVLSDDLKARLAAEFERGGAPAQAMAKSPEWTALCAKARALAAGAKRPAP